MSFVMIIVLIFMASLGCSEKKKEMSSGESSLEIKKMQEEEKRSEKSKIDLLCLKYEVDSETLKSDLLEYLYRDWTIFLPNANNEKNNDKKRKELVDKILSGKVVDTERLIFMSKKHNVPIRKIAGIVYDYMIWKELEQKQ